MKDFDPNMHKQQVIKEASKHGRASTIEKTGSNGCLTDDNPMLMLSGEKDENKKKKREN